MYYHPLWLASLAMLFSVAFAIKPNVLVILTDDQDVRMGSMEHMNGLKTYLQDEGTTYTNHYCTVSLCCPSRVTIWTGKAAHNTNVTDLAPPFGGYPKFISQGYNRKYLPVWLQAAGYNTYYTGKLMNSHTVTNYNHPPAAGLTEHDFLLQPGTYQYLQPIYQRNNETPVTYPGKYTTDLLIDKSLKILERAADGVKSGKPFFFVMAPVAPHANIDPALKPPITSSNYSPPIPSAKYKHLFSNAQVPRNANFNPEKPSGTSWLKQLKRLSGKEVKYNDHWYRQRLRALQSVDELINKTINALDSYGLLENTYIMYTSDNGFHISQHRLVPGKRCPYEEDINVPFVIRGPSIPKGATANFVSSHQDISPTILEWTGATPFAPGDLDGLPIPTSDAGAGAESWEHVQIEHWGGTDFEGKNDNSPIPNPNNTYKALRVIGDTFNLYYSVWCNGDHELYDMTNDTAQMHNIFNNKKKKILGVHLGKLKSRLDALILVLKSCSGETCYNPWAALQPGEGVSSLPQALNAKYDDFYNTQNKVRFEECRNGYFPVSELPLRYNVYQGQSFGPRSEKESRQLEDYENWLRWSD